MVKKISNNIKIAGEMMQIESLLLEKVFGWRPITDISEDNPILHGVGIETKRIGDIDYYRIIEN